MKFVCDSCGVQYLISDEKIGSRGAKVRCKRCGHIIVVKPAGQVSASSPPAEESLSGGPEPFPEKSGEGDELGRAFDRLLEGKIDVGGEGGGQEEEEDDEDGGATQVFNMEDMHRYRQEPISQEEQKKIDAVFSEASSTGVASQPKPAAAEEWYVAIHDEQAGPMDLRELEEYWEKKEIGPQTLAWCQGMPEWTAIQQVPQLKYLLGARAVESAPAAAEAKQQWVTSGSSSLTSLVEEELQAVTSKPPPAEQEQPDGDEGAEKPPGEVPPWERDEVISGEVARPTGSYFDSSLTMPTTDSGSPLPRKSSIVKPAYLSEGGGRRKVWRLVFAGGASALVAVAVMAAVLFADDRRGESNTGKDDPNRLQGAQAGENQGPVPANPNPGEQPGERPEAAETGQPDGGGQAPEASTPDTSPKEGTIVVEKPKQTGEKEPPAEKGKPIRKPGRGGKTEKTVAISSKPRSQEKPAVEEAQETAAVSTSLSKEQIGATMRNYVSAMKKCVAMQKERDPTVTGTMIISFTILPSGKTSATQVQTAEHKGTFVASCILGVISGISFPAFSGPPVTVPRLPLKLGD